MKGKSTLPRKLRKNMLCQTCQNVAFLKTLFIKNYLFTHFFYKILEQCVFIVMNI